MSFIICSIIPAFSHRNTKSKAKEERAKKYFMFYRHGSTTINIHFEYIVGRFRLLKKNLFSEWRRRKKYIEKEKEREQQQQQMNRTNCRPQVILPYQAVYRQNCLLPKPNDFVLSLSLLPFLSLLCSQAEIIYIQ